MNLSHPISVFNLDDFLPSDGETSLEMHYIDRVLILDIFYDHDDAPSGVAKRRIRFAQTKYFFKTPFPGYSFFNCPDDRDLSLLNSLVHYNNSDMLTVECQESGAADYKHYRLFLHSTGVAIHAIAQSCSILSEELID